MKTIKIKRTSKYMAPLAEDVTFYPLQRPEMTPEEEVKHLNNVFGNKFSYELKD